MGSAEPKILKVKEERPKPRQKGKVKKAVVTVGGAYNGKHEQDSWSDLCITVITVSKTLLSLSLSPSDSSQTEAVTNSSILTMRVNPMAWLDRFL